MCVFYMNYQFHILHLQKHYDLVVKGKDRGQDLRQLVLKAQDFLDDAVVAQQLTCHIYGI